MTWGKVAWPHCASVSSIQSGSSNSAHLIGLPEGEARVNIREGLRRAPGTWLISIRLSAFILPLGGCPCVRGSTIFQTGSLCNAGQEFIKASSPEAQVSLNQGRPTLQLLQEGDTLGDLSIQRGLWAVEALLLEPTLGWAPECMLTLAMASSSRYPQGARSYPGRLHTVCPSSASAAFGLGKASAPHGGSAYSPVNPRLQTLCFRVSDVLGSSLSLPVPIQPPAVYPSPAARAVCVAHESEHSARCWNLGKKYNPDTSRSLQRASGVASLARAPFSPATISHFRVLQLSGLSLAPRPWPWRYPPPGFCFS